MYNISYNVRDPIDAVAFWKYIKKNKNDRSLCQQI